jgi:hypothetical protein
MLARQVIAATLIGCAYDSVRELPEDAGPEVPASCPAEATSCPAGCTPISGWPYDATRSCRGAEQTVACAKGTVLCSQSPTCRVRGSDGTMFAFRSDCFGTIAGWPKCDPATTTNATTSPSCP